MSVKGDIPVGLWAVILWAQSTPGSSSTHLPLAESNHFFKAINRVLLEAFAWTLLCRCRGVEYRFFISTPGRSSCMPSHQIKARCLIQLIEVCRTTNNILPDEPSDILIFN